MANRHKVQARARGGRLAYNAKGSHVEHEAEEKNRGGKVVGEFMDGGAVKSRIKRASGGRVGSDKHPFSSAFRGPSGK